MQHGELCRALTGDLANGVILPPAGVSLVVFLAVERWVATVERNQALFNSDFVVSQYRAQALHPAGFWDRGEQAAFLLAASRVRQRPILDLGVGAGRTTDILRLISDDYTAGDYAPEMCAAFALFKPTVPIRLLDARDLSDLDDHSFGLTVFSCNAIDAVPHDQRRQVVDELRRVTAPDGLVIFSTLNKYGMSYREIPFQLKRPTTSFTVGKFLRGIVAGAADPVRRVRRVRTFRQTRPRAEDHGSWATYPMAAHDFAMLIHFTSLPALRRLLDESELETISVFADDGSAIPPHATESKADSFTVVCQPRRY